MKKAIVFIVFIFVIGINSNAQTERKAINIKLNVLNFVAKYPSVAAEFQLGNKTSIQCRAYYADFVFLSRNRMGAFSVGARQYFGQREGINGFYAGLGIDNHFEMDNYYNTGKFNSKYDYGLGPQLAVGYQITTTKRWVWDFGLSYSVYINSKSTGAGVICGIGYKLTK